MIKKEYGRLSPETLRTEWYTERWKRAVWMQEKLNIENQVRKREWLRKQDYEKQKAVGEDYIAGIISDEEYRKYRNEDSRKRVWDKRLEKTYALRLKICEAMITEQDALIAEIEDELEKKTGRRPRRQTGRPPKKRTPIKYDPRKSDKRNNAKRVDFVSERKKRLRENRGKSDEQ